MRIGNRSKMLVVAALLAVGCVGCRKVDDTAPGKPPVAAKNGQNGPEKKVKPKIEEPPPKPTVPTVALSDADRLPCLVYVGDAMPQAELPDLQDKPHSLGQLYGEKLTVVCFWTAGNMPDSQVRAGEVLEFLQTEVAKPFAVKGVRTIGVNVGDPPQVVAQLMKQAGGEFVGLLDRDEALFKKVATEKLPRIYLLDAQGKVVWFTIEFTRSTRRELVQSIQVLLGEV